jgi:hypothetical protein
MALDAKKALVSKSTTLVAIAKLLTGTAIYIAIIAFARSHPGAAGMMLTFPALNGFTLALTDRQDLPKVSGVMLLMPILNCALCAGYIYGFLWLATFTTPWSGWLLVGTSILWGCAAWYVGIGKIGVPENRQETYGVLCALSLLAITAAFLLFQSHSSHLPVSTIGFQDFVHQNMWRIVLFAGCLVLVVALTDVLIPAGLFRGNAAGVLGTLGGFPVVPFFGLLTVAGDEARTIGERTDILRPMGTSVWLGPIVAIGFIHFFSKVLLRRKPRDQKPWDWANKFAFAAVGWTACIMVIAILNFLIDAMRP